MNKLDKEGSVMNEEIICPKCGSSNCSFTYLTAGNAKMAGKALLGLGLLGSFGMLLEEGGDYLLDVTQNEGEFKCNECGHTFKGKDSVNPIVKEREDKLVKLKSQGVAFSSPNNSIIPLIDRQFILLAKKSNQLRDYYDVDGNIKYFFALDNLPSDLKFDSQFPQANVLYMVNPVQTDTYLPFEKAEDILFLDKVREFEYLVGCLGATSIRFKSLKGKKTSSEYESERRGSIGVDVKAVGGSLDGGSGYKEASANSFSSEIGRNQKFNPTNSPYIPTDLVWYKSVPEWQYFVRQRLDNGLTHYHYIFKSSESSSLSSQKKMDISASFKKLALSINARYSQEIKEKIEIQEETVWEVEVDFKPLEEFSNQSGNANKSGFVEIPVTDVTLNDNEQFYYDELQDVLADGVITENDRKRLERRRQRLNISEERAKEIEQMLSPSLTDDEQEYYDELFEVLDDGVIDDKERRSLDRLKRCLGISDSRAKEIEDMAFAKRGLK